jgi:hypothetical protein
VGGEGSIEGVLDDVASFSEIFRVSRVSSFNESLVADCSGQVEFEGSVGGEEDVETTSERVGEVVGKVVGVARSERIRVVRVNLLRFRDGRVGEVSLILFLVLVEP